jgi:AraC family transcriptional regulator
VNRFAGIKVQQALELIDSNLADRLTLRHIAERLDMSPYHLAHVFKRTVGLPPHQYLIHRRIECARHLLQKTDLPIAEVALAVGCANQSHFSALFHRITGLTPQFYRSDR